ncbi:fumarylacetoacetate hydrolase family protein [Leifsonia sp. NPDC058230]|uniref:fumarylacetoacetate hydrolase family protein n=1 Tax=Leifsonia sp. NPDC058230 TaxID=3346391 RepID=UPI0036D86CC9
MAHTSSSPLRDSLLPDAADATLVGRVIDPVTGHPCVVAVRGDRLADITSHAPTTADLLDRTDIIELARFAEPDREWDLETVLRSSIDRDTDSVRLLSPFDLQVIKAAGVTFATSMLERVIEERSKGDPAGADAVRAKVMSAIGGALDGVRPGSPEAAQVKHVLVEADLWSQYLEVGIGPDPEIFTKAPVLSSVGAGAQVGVLERSTWNNPEPEVVLAVTSRGEIVGAALGNDVNLRDFEGRSALLLGEAKDNNASCAIGPFVRIFDGGFDLDDVRAIDVALTVEGADGFRLAETSSMSKMSRDLTDLVAHAFGPHHRYPDGFALFTGTLFAPTQDRGAPGLGFTHHRGDVVRISSPELGSLVNEVTTAEDAPDWTFGIRDLFRSLAARGLIGVRS